MSQLLEPYTLRQLTLLNRIAVSPMCQYRADEGVPGELAGDIATLSMLTFVPEVMLIAAATGDTLARTAQTFAGVSSALSRANRTDVARSMLTCSPVLTVAAAVLERKAKSTRSAEPSVPVPVEGTPKMGKPSDGMKVNGSPPGSPMDNSSATCLSFSGTCPATHPFLVTMPAFEPPPSTKSER